MKLQFRSLRKSLPPLIFAATLATPLTARAEDDAASKALAVQLFDEAEALLAKGQVADACPKYAESNRLDPQLGVLIYLAECYEKNGQLASAWGSFREAEEIARKRGDQRAEHARERSAALEPRLAHLIVQVPAASRVPGLQVLRDDAQVAPVLWGSRAAIDPGTHRFEARAPSHKPWHGTATVAGDASSVSVEVPKLEPVALEANSAAGADTETQRAPSFPSQRIAAIAVGGLGLVGVGVGGFLGLSAQSSLSDAKGECNDANYCTERGDTLRTSAKSKALGATIATGVGLAALTTAAVLWFTAPIEERVGVAPRRKRAQAWAVAPTNNAWGLEMTHAF